MWSVFIWSCVYSVLFQKTHTHTNHQVVSRAPRPKTKEVGTHNQKQQQQQQGRDGREGAKPLSKSAKKRARKKRNQQSSTSEVCVCHVGQLLTLGAHAQRGLQYLLCVSVCLSVCLFPL